MKTLSNSFIVSLIILFGFSNVSASPELSIGSAIVKQGENASIDLRLSGGDQSYAGFNAKILFPNGVQPTEIVKGELLSDNFTTDYHIFDNGISVIAYSDANTISSNEGLLMSLKISASNDADVGPKTIAFASVDDPVMLNSKYALSNADGSASVEPTVKSGQITVISKDNNSERHFKHVWSGEPYQRMIFWVIGATIDNHTLSIGDEIGIFDGDVCVGALTVTHNITKENPLAIKTSQDDDYNDNNVNGFVEGNAITFKFWDQSENIEISVSPDYQTLEGQPVNSLGFVALGDYAAILEGDRKSTQTIHLAAGWNIISSYVIPDDLDMLNIFQPIIDKDKLVKVIDEAGNTVIQFFGSWKNHIGTFADSEGYKVKVKEDVDLIIEGTKSQLPMTIDLKSGWNIIGYPKEIPQITKDVFKPLIDNDQLIKVIDEKGDTLIKFFGNWMNKIGDLEPLKGYMVKVKSDAQLIINKELPSRKRKIRNSQNVRESASEPKHFSKVWTGYPYDRMGLWVVGLSGLNPKVNDEIAVFDGDNCVGVGVVENINISKQASVEIKIAKDDDPNDSIINGFIEGNPIIFKYWDGQSEYTNITMKYMTLDGSEIEPPTFSGNSDYGVELFVTSEAPAQHCQKVWDGHPYNPMNLYIIDIEGYNYSINDEICIYDNENCVGTEKISTTISQYTPTNIKCSGDDDLSDGQVNGFFEGNNIHFVVWDHINQQEISDFVVTFYSMDGTPIETKTFELMSDYAVKLSKPTGQPPTISPIDDIEIPEDSIIGSISFTVNDDKTSPANLIVNVHSSDQSLIPDEKIIISGEGTDRNINISTVKDAFGKTIITLTVTDEDNLSATTSFTVTVLPVNDIPIISPLSPINTDEDTMSNKRLFTVSDVETPQNDLIVTAVSNNATLVINDNILLGIEDEKRSIQIQPNPNSYGEALITVQVADSEGLSNYTSFNLTVYPVNDHPNISISTIVPIVIKEGDQIQPVAFTVSDIETPPNQLIAKAVSDNSELLPNDNLVVSGNDSSKQLIISPVEGKTGIANITISVKDEGNFSANEQFTLTVNKKDNTCPTITSIDNIIIDEDTLSDPMDIMIQDNETPVSQIQIDIASSNQALIPVDSEHIKLEGDGELKQLIIRPMENISGSSQITIVVSDEENCSSQSIFNVTVLAVNDMPIISPLSPINTDEDTMSNKILFTVSDVETPQNDLIVTAVSNNATLVINDNILLGIEDEKRSIQIQPNPNSYGEALITVKVADPEGLYTSSSFKFTVEPINDQPTISAIDSIVIKEGNQIQPVVFTVSDIETLSSLLIVTAVSDNIELLSNDNLNVSGNDSSKQLTISPVEGKTGSANITISVKDEGNLSATEEFTLTVHKKDNTCPTITSVDNIIIDEDTLSGPIDINIHDNETPAALLQIDITSSNLALVPDDSEYIILEGDGELKQLIIRPMENISGSSQITIVVSDEENCSSQSTFNITVLPVNDSPEISSISNHSTNEDTNSQPISFNIYDLDNNAQDLNLSVQSDNPDIIPNDNEHIVISRNPEDNTGTIVLKPTPNQWGSVNINVIVSDTENKTDEATFTLNVLPVNDRPIISDIDYQQMDEDSSKEIDFTVFDIDNDGNELNITASSSNTNLIQNSGIELAGTGNSRKIIITPVQNQTDESIITIRVTDPEGLEAKEEFSIVVLPVNDIPEISEISDQKTPANTLLSVGFTINDLESSGDDLLVSVLSTNASLVPNNDSHLLLKGTGNDQTLEITPAVDQSGETTILITVIDEGELSTTEQFDLSVQDNVPPIISLLGDTPLAIKLGSVFIDPGAMAVDNGNDISERIEAVNNVDVNSEGYYHVKYNVTDTSGNKAIEVIRIVLVYADVDNIIIKGNVVDQNDLILKGVNVVLMETTNTTVTDENGYFELSPIKDTGKVRYINFSKPGHESIVVRFTGTQSLDNIVLPAEETFTIFEGICIGKNGNPLSQVMIHMSHDSYPATSLSDENGHFRIAVDSRGMPFDFTAIKKGYRQLSLTQDDLSEITMYAQTKLLIQKPETQQEHDQARHNNSVNIIVKADPPFSGPSVKPDEIRIFLMPENTEIEQSKLEFDNNSHSYLTQLEYDDIELRIKADTTEDGSVTKGSYNSRSVYFAKIPESSILFSTKTQTPLNVTPGRPIIMKSNHEDSHVFVNIPANGFQGDLIPETIECTISEYENLDSQTILGKVIDLELTDELGNVLGATDDTMQNPLKQICLTMDYSDPVTKAGLKSNIYQIHTASSVTALLNNQGSVISELTSIDEDTKTVSFCVDHLSAFGIQKQEEEVELKTSGDDGGGCLFFIVSEPLYQSDLTNVLYNKFFIVFFFLFLIAVLSMIKGSKTKVSNLKA